MVSRLAEGIVFDLLKSMKMGLRTYTDREGRRWNVWDVPPRFSPLRAATPRRAQTASRFSPERRHTADRRVTVPPPEWVHGWMCFQNGSDKLRLCPLPAGWQDASDEQLEQYRQQATAVTKTPVR